jgi:hypothetical protein
MIITSFAIIDIGNNKTAPIHVANVKTHNAMLKFVEISL